MKKLWSFILFFFVFSEKQLPLSKAVAAGLTHNSVTRYLDFSMNVCELQSRKKKLQYSQKRKKKHFKEENIIFLLFIKGRFSREESSANMTAVRERETHRPTPCNQCIKFWDSLVFGFFSFLKYL